MREVSLMQYSVVAFRLFRTAVTLGTSENQRTREFNFQNMFLATCFHSYYLVNSVQLRRAPSSILLARRSWIIHSCFLHLLKAILCHVTFIRKRFKRTRVLSFVTFAANVFDAATADQSDDLANIDLALLFSFFRRKYSIRESVCKGENKTEKM